MKEAVAESAVGYFTDNVEQFHALYGTSPGFQERFEIWSRLLRQYSRPGGVAIDMGCGPGVFSFLLADLGLEVVGIDGAPDMVQACEARREKRGLRNVRFIQEPCLTSTRRRWRARPPDQLERGQASSTR